ncbi:galectin-1-like [Podarcis raffonei]|uniref:galectin-1-like n=1 Tax=Podarcis raffonei TaxID=65483 RepID=UPI0023291651|nr:galectin-1-like [Podarcis raffonei]
MVARLNLKAGERIEMKAKVPREAKSFTFHIGRNASNPLLQFNARFETFNGDRVVLFNSETGRERDLLLDLGLFVTVAFSFTAQDMVLEVFNRPIIRLPTPPGMQVVEHLAVTGDIDVKSITFSHLFLASGNSNFLK